MQIDEATVENMIKYFGEDKIPNPDQYPKQFEFLLKSYEHYLKMQKGQLQKQ